MNQVLCQAVLAQQRQETAPVVTMWKEASANNAKMDSLICRPPILQAVKVNHNISFTLFLFSLLACSCPSSLNCDKFTGRCPCSTNDTSCCPYDQYFNGSHCINCSCSINGSHQVCTETGQCVCKPGVGGRACDRCLAGYHSLSSSGCKPCSCNVDGSNDPSICDPETGKCSCLPGVEGDQCDRCPLHTLGPVRGGALTCIPCFCNGYSTTCRSSRGWYWSEASSRFGNESASQDWLARNSHSSIM